MSRLLELTELSQDNIEDNDVLLIRDFSAEEDKHASVATITSLEKARAESAEQNLNLSKQPKTLETPITVGSSETTTVEAALSAINADKERIESKFDNEIEEIADGTSIAKKAERDAGGNVITDTYFRKDGGVISGDVEIGSSSSKKSLEIHGNETVNGTLQVNGDIIQNGSSYETHAEQVFSKNDLIVTRDGAISALSDGEYTGIKAKKYDGTNDGLLAFNKDGEARVGDLVAETHSYTVYSSDGDTFYADSEMTELVEIPSGINPLPTENENEYTYQLISIVDDTQPLLTRSELASMTNKGILTWNSTKKRAETAPVPQEADKVPVSKADGSFEWKTYSAGGNGVAFIGTRAQYNVAKLIKEGETGYIPSGSMVIITNENEILRGETVNG